MDPDACLAYIRSVAARMIADNDNQVELDTDDAISLAEHIRALDEWLSNGDFLPHDWDL
jgi:hypothetical protein